MTTIEKIRAASLPLLPAIFAECLADEDGAKYDCSAPWIEDGWVVGTDGRILARAPLDSLGAVGPVVAAILGLMPNRRVPTMANLYDGVQWSDAETPLPELPGAIPCEACQQKRFYRNEDVGAWWSCDSCEGTGWYLDRYQRVSVSETLGIGLGFAWILKRHGAVLYLPQDNPGRPVDVASNGKECEIKFVADGAEGVLMPMTTEEVA